MKLNDPLQLRIEPWDLADERVRSFDSWLQTIYETGGDPLGFISQSQYPEMIFYPKRTFLLITGFEECGPKDFGTWDHLKEKGFIILQNGDAWWCPNPLGWWWKP